MRKNQKGFTLVELIIAVAILAIVTLAVCGFIVVGSRSYTSANTDIMLQQDAQLALNQISDVIIDTTDSISYGVRAGGVGDMQLVLKDSEFGGEATEKCLAVVNRKEAGSNNDNESYWFYWSKDDEIIYFNKVEAYSSTMSMSEIQSKFEEAADQSRVSILAQHVTDFSVDLTQFEANRVVMLSVTFENGNRMYSTSNNVTVRNRIALNELTVGPLKRAEEFTINTVTSVTLEPGDSFPLASKVTVTTPSSDQAIKFEIVGGDQYGTRFIDGAGTITIGKEDMRENFSVKVSRTNEQYAGENDRVAKTIKINIKRATDVNITGPASAKQGETVDLTGSARGNLLGVRCDQCIGDDLSKDWTVYDWKITGDATVVTSDTGAATIKINDDATVGSKVVVEASSVLSRDKNGGYGPASAPTLPPVTGKWEITVEKKTTSTRAMPGSFRFDQDEDVLSWLTQGLRYRAKEYVVYARVKDPTGKMADRVAIYYTNLGENMRFYPDMFGLELDRSYQLYLQAIFPVHNDEIAAVKSNPNNGGVDDFSGSVHKYDDQIADYILSHLGPSGEYIGTDYDAGFYYEGTINPPAISIQYNGHVYPSNDNYCEKYSLFSSNDTVIGSIMLNQSGVMNIEATSSLNGKIFFSIYKGEGDNVSDWEFVAGYDPSIEPVGAYPSADYINSQPAFKNTNMFYLRIEGASGANNLTKDNYFKRKTDISDFTATGTYHIVPGFIYANRQQLDGRNYLFLYRNYLNVADFKEHFYQQPDCAITLKVEASFNLDMAISGGKKAKMMFPLPSDGGFPFVLQKEGEQELPYWPFASYDIYDDSNVKITTISLKPVCTWDKSNNTYTIKFYNWNGDFFGEYKCRYGADHWECTNAGTATGWW